jgi:hypothetical protein
VENLCENTYCSIKKKKMVWPVLILKLKLKISSPGRVRLKIKGLMPILVNNITIHLRILLYLIIQIRFYKIVKFWKFMNKIGRKNKKMIRKLIINIRINFN